MTNPADTDQVRQPKLLSYCSALYARFVEQSTVETVDGDDVTVWRGKITKTCSDVGIPDGVYKRVMDQLHALNCIEQVERGYRGQWPTTVILLRPPTAEVWEDEIRARDLTRGLTPAILSRRISDLEERLKGVDIKLALAELQQQIDDIRVCTLNGTQQEIHQRAIQLKNNKESG